MRSFAYLDQSVSRFFRTWRGVIALAVLLIGTGLALRWLASQAETVTRWMDVYMPNGYMEGFFYVCSVAVLTCLIVPRQLLSSTGGYVLGPLCGAVFVTLDVTLDCVLVLGVARCCGRPSVERRYGDKATIFNRYAAQYPFILAILTRLFLSGNNLVFSLLAGVSRIPAWPSSLRSCPGYIPQGLLFAIIENGIRVDEGWRTRLSTLLFAASCALGWWFYRRYAAAYPMEARNEYRTSCNEKDMI